MMNSNRRGGRAREDGRYEGGRTAAAGIMKPGWAVADGIGRTLRRWRAGILAEASNEHGRWLIVVSNGERRTS